MKGRSISMIMGVVVTVAGLATGAAKSGQDKYAVKVPDGLAFAEFRGYEHWETISVSQNAKLIAVILGNPAMVSAFEAGIPGNGQPFPQGAKMAKIHWIPKPDEIAPGRPLVPGTLHDVDFMVKDSDRFADSGGWGYAAFEYNPTSDEFRPGTAADQPPQGNDAKCGFACHSIVQNHDYVFTSYQKR